MKLILPKFSILIILSFCLFSCSPYSNETLAKAQENKGALIGGMYPNSPVYGAMYNLFLNVKHCSNIDVETKNKVFSYFPIIQANVIQSAYAAEAKEVQEKVNRAFYAQTIDCKMLNSNEAKPTWAVWTNRMRKTADLILRNRPHLRP